MILVMRAGVQHSQAQLWERFQNNHWQKKTLLGDSFKSKDQLNFKVPQNVNSVNLFIIISKIQLNITSVAVISGAVRLWCLFGSLWKFVETLLKL